MPLDVDNIECEYYIAHGHHDWEAFIDPNSGLFERCKSCGLEQDLEEDEDW